MVTYEQYVQFCLRIAERTKGSKEAQAKAILESCPPPPSLYREICLVTLIEELDATIPSDEEPESSNRTL